jgi:carboxypeptidase family protein/TonB-dependent receptor-like protein
VRGVIFLLIVSLLCVVPAIAQSPNATINGLVLDSSGAAIAGAQIVVVNDATGVQYTAKTNGEGIYVVPNLPPGPYRIQVSNSGFKTIIKPDIVIHVQDALAINFTLPIGAASEIVTVQGGAPLVNTENAAVSTVIDRQFVENLPLNGRSFNTLLQLTPGVVIAQASSGSPGQFSISGQRTSANNFVVDGVSANFGVSSIARLGESGTGTSQAFSALGATSSLVSVDTLQEFRIETSSFAPEFGRSPGGQVVLATRSGTNMFHGGVFEYFRNDVLDANSWFANQAGQPRAAERHNDFGGFLGGALWKDKTFFFFSYEGARLRLPQSVEIRVPSQFARRSATAAAAPFLNAYPRPDDETVTPGIFSAPSTGTFSNSATLNATSIRVDHRFGNRYQVFGRYNFAPSQTADRGNVFSEVNPTDVDTQLVTVGVNMSLGHNIFNALRGNYSVQNAGLIQGLDSFKGAVPLDTSLLLGPLPHSENRALFFAGGLAGPYAVGHDAANRARQFNLVDDLSITVGTHQLKFGGDYRAIVVENVSFKNLVGFFVFNLQGFVNSGSGFLVTETVSPAKMVTQAVSLYAQDSWKISPRLAMIYGLRWELSPAPLALGSTTLTSWTNVNDPAQIALAPPGTSLWHTAYGNFAPRLGVAYSLNQASNFVLRAGVGMFYDLGLGESGQLASAFPSTSTALAPSSVPIGDPTPFLPPPVSLQPPFPAVEGFSQDLELPRSYQWNVALEKSFKGRDAISATYVGQAGRRLLRKEDLFQPNSNFSSTFDLTRNSARSNYNALQVQYRRPLSSRVQALLNYTWSHSLDNASDDVVRGLSNTVISGANDYASSDFDVRHSFSGAVTYSLPFTGKSRLLSAVTKGWSVDGVVVARSGFPFNAQVQDFSINGGAVSTRPDLNPRQPFYLYGSQCASVLQSMGALLPGQSCPGGRGLNPAAFSAPSTPRQGTEGRNDIPGFRLTQIDLSLGRKFAITEQVNLQFRTDTFNLFNHPNFTNPPAFVLSNQFTSQRMLNQGLGGLSPLFQEGGPRSLQLSLRLAF